MDKSRKETLVKTAHLREVDNVEIVSLVDNSVDIISTIEREEVQQVRKWVEERKSEEWVKKYFHHPIAEHGFSMLVQLFYNGKSHRILFDCGGSPEVVVTNIQRMGLDLSDIEAIVLSHGHDDHCGGLTSVLKVISKENLPIIIHKDMLKTRGVITSDGTIRKHPDFPTEDQVKPATYVKTKQPYLLADGTILVTGEIPRATDFEKGFLQQRAFIDGKWQPDTSVLDDRAIVIKIKKKGLVIISGCAHAGIINTTLYTQKITGVTNILAVMGGFHLAGKEYEQRISQTVKELKRINPTIVVPTHCTGWRGFYSIKEAMPQACVWNSVGNLYKF